MKHITLFVALFMACYCYAQDKNSAYPSDFGTSFVLKGKTVQVPVTINNTGSNVINNLIYVLTSDGVDGGKRQVKLTTPIKSGESGEITLTFKADTEARKSNKVITITHLNNAKNTSEQKSANGSVVTLLEKPVVVPVVEEFTGTWCGWCPVGFDGMENAHEIFGDKVALIAIHYGDVMQANEFQNLVQRVSGFPSAIIDRLAGDFYPSNNEIKKQINNEIQNKIAGGTIEVNAAWANAAKSSIKIDTKTTFVYSEENGNYGIAYALTQDGMKGSGSDWTQNNNLSGNANYANSNPFWYKSPSRVTNIEFNHVGVAAWGLEDGIEGSVNPVIVAGEEQTYSYTASITGKKLIQDKNKLNVIVMLIDRTTGNIVNAASTTIDDYATAINGIEQSPLSVEQSVFDLSGRKITSQPKKGIYIVNGKKVAYK